MKFCSACGASVSLQVPAGDSLPRHVCVDCGEIHYLNPKMVVGAIPVWEEKILLCRRAIEPRLGKWTLPAGFMENRETTAEAAARETLEEACARITVGPLFALVNIPEISQVHLFYRAQMLDLEFAAGIESLEVALFAESDIPWDTLAFRSVRFALERFFEDRRNGQYGTHAQDLSLLHSHTKEGT
ncbi:MULTISPECIES: NUDIX hydrolase [Denitromonas]|uniref:NUDIX domain-containing protein n=2 Tax=Denitromonas TaxID=139331 RepID=A0A558CK39_9RHOO|nr:MULTISPECIES: NUDIX hydrolase [Denitromonas]TVO59756.1 NUDIX domain-containing protein [Denitromonas halophila]TVO69061.1 NUDIX domain-containing protein [Denitromonas ohlonensis]TVO77161.1 NUDIX domain-containing protein [Denitromonas ohlonensis]TVT49119.1 MAG: NUDIX domain-containing protein [Denitromonas halophila]TVT73325.1 MAG: NUDIX domain-containing protein [Denitromonas halophila]